MATTNYWYVDHDSKEEKETEKKKHGFSGYENRTSSNSERIIVSLLPEYGTMSQLVLPVNPEGKYSFSGENNLQLRESVHIQPYHEKWYLYSLKPVHFLNESNKYLSYVEMKDQELVLIKNLDEEYRIYVEYVTKQAFVSHNYAFLHKSITIGSSDDCDITYHGKYVSAFHAEMIFDNNQWEIVARGQANSFLVNGKRMKNSKITVGDMIYIMGLKLIMGVNFISINDGNERVKIHGYKLNKIHAASEISFFEDTKSKPVENELFNRLPRRRMPLNKKEIKIEAPPMTLSGEKIPLMLRMGGSMVMGANSVLMGNYTTMLSSVLFPVLTSKYTDKQKKDYEKRRVEKYTEYLERKRKEIEVEKLNEEKVLNYNYPELEQVLSYPYDGQRLWERRKTDDDFLNIRLGYGSILLMAEYKYPEERFGLDEDCLEDKMYELARKKVFLDKAPIMNSFIENFVCGILGSRRLVLSFVKRLVMQIAISHSYDEVKIVFLIDESDLKEMEYFRYIPHVWNDQKTFRFLATNAIEAFQVSEYLKKEVEEELGKSYISNKISDKRPYYMVFALEKKIFDSMEVLKDIMQSEKGCGVSVITAFEDLPKECFKIFQLHSNGDNVVINLKELDQGDIQFRTDRFDERVAFSSMNQLANTNLRIISQAYSLPKMITFLEMFGVGRIEHLNPLQRWHDHNPVKSLAAPIGIGTDGTLFELDLHEKYQGPHGLIAGMTGSGKSEFIITYILSMAVNYHPDEVAFLLIDYKGGGLASAFEDKARGIHLPHLVGTITNLDGAAINRALISIHSELTRRQRLFNDAKSKVGESSIDIYSYQQLYRRGQVEEALPHLFVIADEFAEMKQQQPEFMESLISIARIGRSLGVHLILATQKPSGVVNDQIRSNTKFRVCLKVQDKSDSLDMLKRPEGAELKETGRFYLQVGYNEYFALGQSAWSGADYEAQDEVVVQKDDSAVFIDTTGQNIYEIKPEVKKTTSGKSQLTEIVQYLSNLAKIEHIVPKKLWKEPLQERIDFQSAAPKKEKGNISVFVGQVDDPIRQQQYPYFYNFLDCKNILIVGEGKCGKTTMIQNMLVQLTMYYGADDINYYVLDYSSHMLKLFKNVPHCGAVLSEDDEATVKPFFDLLEKISDERKEQFSKLEVDNFKSAREKIKLPIILVVIDDINGLTASKITENYYYTLNTLIKKMSNYGIYFIISCSHLNEIATRIRQEIGDTFALTLKDKYEYQDAIGCRIDYIPPSIPGRGLINKQGEALELQGSMPWAECDDNERVDRLKGILSELSKMNSKSVAVKLPSFTNDETYLEFSKQFSKRRIPLGYSIADARAVALPLKQFNSLSIYFGNPLGEVPILENILARAEYEEMAVTVIPKKRNSIFLETSKKTIDTHYLPKIKIVPFEQEIIYEAVNDILLGMMNNTHFLKEYCNDQGMKFRLDELPKDFQAQVFSYMYDRVSPQLIIIENVKDLCDIADVNLTTAIEGLCVTMPLYNTYVVACYEPGNATRVSGHLIHQLFNKEEMAVLFGGCYDRQGIVELEHKWKNINQPIDYNQGLMKYRGSIYPLMMPCGELIKEMEEEDDRSIF